MEARVGTPQNLNYWYSGFKGGNSTIPVQAIPFKRKNEGWKKATMDAFEHLGTIQVIDNLKFRNYYRMIEGKLDFVEVAEVIPQLREVSAVMDDFDIPTTIKHYDIIGIIINALVGEYMQNSDKFFVVNHDEFSTSEYERTKSDLVKKFIKESFAKELQLRLLSQGYNPNPESLNIQDPKQLQQYIIELQKKKEEMTPPQIEKYMTTSWRTTAAIWGQNQLRKDTDKFLLDTMDKKELIDKLGTGRCFRHFRLGYDYYTPERWSPINTFFSQELDTEYVQDGEYVGRIDFLTGAKVIEKYGYLLSEREKKKILGGDTSYNGQYTSSGGKKSYLGNSGETHIVPHRQYYEYDFMLDLQEELGVPLGRKTMLRKDGTEETLNSYLPRQEFHTSMDGFIAQKMRDDIQVRSDLLKAVEVYWVSYKRIAYVTYKTPSGRLTQEIVTEDLLSDFLKENDIKSYTNRTLKEVEDDPEESTIVWDYMQESWEGVKISGGNLDEPLYLKVQPTEFQLKGDSEGDVKLPVAGHIGASFAQKLLPFQKSYNVAMNQAYNLMEKEIGMFFIFDISFLPAEFKNWGDSEETLLHLRDIIKNVGLLPVDSTKDNIGRGGAFNQFKTENLSFGPQIQRCLEIADMYKWRAFEQVGYNPGRLGQPTKYETAEGIRVSQTSSYSQTEGIFDTFSSYKQRMLELHLGISQFARKNNKDISLFYSTSDLENVFLKFSDPYLSLRRLNILPRSNASKRKQLENFKNYLLNTNTLGEDSMSLATLFTSDTMSELIETARRERLHREELQAQQQQMSVQAQQQAIALQEQVDAKKWEREELSKQRDRDTKLEEERINALGRAADNNANKENLDYINRYADLALRKQAQEAEIEIKQGELALKKEQQTNLTKENFEKLKLEIEKLRMKNKELDVKKYTSEINKN